MLWHEDDMLYYVLRELPQEIFNKEQREILNRLELYSNEGKKPDLASASKDLSEEANNELTRILMNGSDNPREEEVDLFHDAVNVLKCVALKKKYNTLLAQADEYISSDKETYRKKVEESLKIKWEIDKLKKN